MLTEIKLTNFKCFKEETAIPLSQFNLFTGVNGAGKSTALQALLLMRQSIEHNPYTTEIILNGSCVSLGGFDDVKNNQISIEESIIFELTSTQEKDKFLIHYHLNNINNKMSLFISKIDVCLYVYLEHENEYYTIDSTSVYDEESRLYCRPNEDVYKRGISFRLNNPISCWATSWEEQEQVKAFNPDFDVEKIYFVSADRIGPQEFYEKANLPEFINVGTKGEFTVNVLNNLSQELVNETLCLGEDARTLLTQTEAWLGKILNPLKLEVNSLGKANFLELLIGGFKPSNVGFGYSSILPIIVTGLIAKPNEKIIIENPEIHLHPKAQSALIEFLVKVANTGVQIFIESHSDHILNALRIATKNNLLKPEDSSILFFDNNTVNNSSDITSILIDEKGKLHRKTPEGTVAKIPKGFFDEWTNSMAKLF